MTGPRIWRFASVLLTGAILTGCASSRSWSYTPEPRSASEQLANVSVIVLPFEDRRPKENSNFIFIYLIPLVPFGFMDFETPEGPQMHVNSGLWQFRPADDFARAVAQEIDNARIFREAFVGNRASEADYVLLGEITSTKYEGKMITYGLSVYGPLLWFFGFPAGYTSNGLTLTLKLAKTPASPAIWTHTISQQASATSWIYALQPDFTYDQLLKTGLRDALTSLGATARTLK